MRSRYRPPLAWERGRLFATIAPDRLSLPRIAVIVDGPELVIVGLSVGTKGCDPALAIDISLSGTRAGRVVFETYWWIREWFERASR